MDERAFTKVYEIVIFLTNGRQFKRCIKSNGSVGRFRGLLKQWRTLDFFMLEIDSKDYYFNPQCVTHISIEKVGEGTEEG